MLRFLSVLLFCAGIFCLAQSNAQVPMTGAGLGTPAVSGYTPQGIQFNGSTDIQIVGATFTGAPSSSAVGTLSFWYQSTGGNGTTRGVFQTGTPGSCTVQLVQLSSNVLRLDLANATTTLISNSSGTTAFANGDAWRWVGLSWNLAATAFQMYVNGVSDSPGGTPTNGNMDYTATCFNGWAWGSLINSTFVTGNFADVYFDVANFNDFSVAGNLHKFYNAGNAVDLGSTCQTPSGSTPIMCFKGPLAGPWNTSKGTGGGFTVPNGSLSNAATNPP